MLRRDQNKNSQDHILEIATAFMASKHLFVAAEIGLFQCLADGARTLEDLSRQTGFSQRTLRVLADAMVALGLLLRKEDEYQNDPGVTALLGGNPETGLRPFLRFWNHIAYPHWMKLEEAVRTSRPIFGGLSFEEEDQKIFSEGIESLTNVGAQSLVTSYDFNQHHRILDLGGGTGSFLIILLGHFSHLRGTLYETPAVIPIARQRLQNSAIWERVELVEGDFFENLIPENHDVILIANVMHSFSPEQNMRLLRLVRQRVAEKTRLLLVDFWTDPTHTKPLFSAMIVGEFLLYTGVGDVYSVEEVNDWLGKTEWQTLEDRSLTYPETLIIAESV